MSSTPALSYRMENRAVDGANKIAVILLNEQGKDVKDSHFADDEDAAYTWIKSSGGGLKANRCYHCSRIQSDLVGPCHSCGCRALTPATVDEIEAALERARNAEGTTG